MCTNVALTHNTSKYKRKCKPLHNIKLWVVFTNCNECGHLGTPCLHTFKDN